MQSTSVLTDCEEGTDATTPLERGRSPLRSVGSGGRPGVEDKGVADTAAAIDLRRFADTSHRFANHAGS
jgi:hypothetical protein